MRELAIVALEEKQRLAGRFHLQRDDPAQHDIMVARFMHGFEPAVDPGHHPVQYRGAIGRHPMRHARELVVRAIARKLLAERLLVAGEDVDPEFPPLFDAASTVLLYVPDKCKPGRVEASGG